MRSRQRTGFTLIETAAAVGSIAVLVALAQPAGQRQASRQARDADQLRGIHQGMVLWAQNNADVYPLPSRLDTADNTVLELGAAKNTTANIVSIMLYNGLLPLPSTVSPVERNDNIDFDFDYHYTAPPDAVNPALALWDPSFSADFTAAEGGNFSYAHLQPSLTAPGSGRIYRWTNTFQSTEVILSNRAPQIASVQHNGDTSATVTFADRRSNTLKFYGNAHTWSGHLVYNDNHVVFSDRRLAPGGDITQESEFPARYYFTSTGQRHLDLWCYDEPDDPAATNDFVGIFTTAGVQAPSFTPIWD
jgi:type II secretory pathway pseudopilin PulG